MSWLLLSKFILYFFFSITQYKKSEFVAALNESIEPKSD